MKQLEKAVEAIANEKVDGHYTIMKFTTGYKGFFGTYSECEDYPTLRDYLNELPIFKTKKELYFYLVTQQIVFDYE